MEYPTTHTGTKVDILHGVQVPDPYRWLEDPGAEEVADWVDRQARFTRTYLDSLGNRDAIRQQLTAIWDHPKHGVPWHRGPRWFAFRNSGLQQQSVLWTMDAPGEVGRVLLDPTELSADGTVSLSLVSVSDDGALLAYGTSDGGSDWITWSVRDIASGVDHDDRVRWAKFAGAAWAPDSSGFFYGAYDPPPPGEELAATTTNHQLRFHRLGQVGPDTLVYARPDQPDWGFSPIITQDGRWLVVQIWQGTQPRNRVYLARIGQDPTAVTVQPWLDDCDAEYGFVGNDGDTMFVQTDLDAANGRLLAISATDPRQRREVIAESPNPLLAVRHIGGRFVVVEMVDAVHRLSVRESDGTEVSAIAVPDLASVGEITGRHDDEEAHLSLSSFTASSGIHRLAVRPPLGVPPTLTQVRPPAVQADDMVTRQVFVGSTGGAMVPLFLIHRRDAVPDRTNRTILYGYGGFNIPLSPEFRLWWITWLVRGGTVAVGCYRGGGEYGRGWHDDGRLDKKPHTFDDALACARWLDTNDWASPANIAITGGSNGGLTAAATMLRAPHAFGACVPEVGVLDLLRFNRFTIGWAWTSDYGDPEDPGDFPLIHSMSPYHTALDTPGSYPATLIVTADRDDRVVPAHSLKFTAAL